MGRSDGIGMIGISVALLGLGLGLGPWCLGASALLATRLGPRVLALCLYLYTRGEGMGGWRRRRKNRDDLDWTGTLEGRTDGRAMGCGRSCRSVAFIRIQVIIA